jgi:sarcosine oxidase
VVVGAGVFGSSLTHRLTEAGWRVTLVEQYSPGHVRAASGDESRLIRFAHGSDRWYTRSAWRARDLWRQLEEESGRRLLVECGLAWFARNENAWEAESEGALAAEGVPFERLTPEGAADLFPSFDGSGLAFVLYEPRAGILRARDAVGTLVEQAVRRGATLVRGRAMPDRDAAVVNGERLEADRVVWACGPWLPGVFPGLVRLRVTKQDVLYFGADSSWESPPVPGWVDYDGAVYGMGDVDGRGVKVAPDREGPEFDADRDARVPSPDAEPAARRAVTERFPALADAPLIGTRACPYALTPDTQFVIAPHPEHERVWVLGGGSGHGFKHGPALAEYVLSLLDGRAAADPRFGLDERAAATKLRTAGAT